MPLLNFTVKFNFDNSPIKILNQNFAQINQTVGSSASAVSDLNKKISKLSVIQAAGAVSTIITNTAAAFKGMAANVEKAVSWAGQYAEQGDKIAKTSRLVGLSAKEFQAFDSAARHAGMSSEEMTSALQRMNVNLGKARSGDATALKQFDSILGGRSLSTFKDNAEVLRALAGGYSKLESAEQKAFVSQALFGRSGLKMSELLSQGEESLGKYLDEYEAAFSDEGAKNAEAFNDSLQDMQESLNVLKVSLAQDLFPVFTEVFGSIRAFFKSDEGKKKLEDFKTSLVSLVNGVLPKIPAILEGVLSIVGAIGPTAAIGIAAFTTLLPVLAQIAILLKSLWGFLGVFKTIGMFVFKIFRGFGLIFDILRITFAVVGGAGVASFLAVVGIVVGLVSIVKQFYDNWEMWCSFVNHELTDAVNGFFSKLWEGVKSVGAALYDFFVAPFVNAFDMLPMIWGAFKEGIGKVADMFMELGGQIFDAIFGAVRRAWDAAKGFLSNLPLVGGLFEDEAPANPSAASATAAESIGEMVRSTNTTTTSRFAVDFQNMPRGVTVTPPGSGDFDFSRGYVFGGGV